MVINPVSSVHDHCSNNNVLYGIKLSEPSTQTSKFMQLPKMDAKSGNDTRALHHDQVLMLRELQNFPPEPALDFIVSWFISNPVQLRISRSRTTKYGDYRAQGQGLPPKISVNHNLNKFDFLITLVHEMAHHVVFETFNKKNGFVVFLRKKSRPKPHGKEWKDCYRTLMLPLMIPDIFPPEILTSLEKYFNNPRASAGTNHHLVTVLHQYNVPDGKEFIEDLPIDAIFQIPGGRTFLKKEKLRKRYRCISIATKRVYLFSPVARVSRIG